MTKMSREAREKLLERIYKQQLRSSGRLPCAEQQRAMERKAALIAERARRKTKMKKKG